HLCYVPCYLYSAYTPYSYRYQPPKGKGPPGAWRQRGTYFSGYGDTAAAAAAEYFDNYQRAQLKAILSQVNPSLTPRLRKANTKEVGVQVNPRQDASVQCSLGPRTLLRRRPGPGLPSLRPRQGVAGSPGAGPRVTGPGAAAILCGGVTPCTAASTLQGAGAGLGRAGLAWLGAGSLPWLSNPCSPQFLEQKYGYYHCKDCNIRWESAYVWCVQGTNKVYFRQFCRTCQKSYNPYRVEDITCQSCKQTRCTCPVKVRHVDPKRPHRQDLCGRCKGKRLSCDSTFSFKYII
uniref:Zygote arrest 1 n=1 Tax=Gopherus evgoodei TaxID=1825980 RepID=A0A8C4WIH1_9SAUR